MTSAATGYSLPPELGPTMVRALLFDADGTLFPSEEPAFEASALVTQEFAADFGLVGDFSADHLRRTTTGKNFRTTAQELLARVGISLDQQQLQSWVSREEREVTEFLGQSLSPIPDVERALGELRRTHQLAAVSSSALRRLAACFTACALDDLIPPDLRFSAENSLAVPTSKPDPAIYRFALAELGLTAQQAVAIEDSVTGVRSAVAAGIVTVGLVEFVPEDERSQRCTELLAAGASLVTESWCELADVLRRTAGSTP